MPKLRTQLIVDVDCCEWDDAEAAALLDSCRRYPDAQTTTRPFNVAALQACRVHGFLVAPKQGWELAEVRIGVFRFEPTADPSGLWSCEALVVHPGQMIYFTLRHTWQLPIALPRASLMLSDPDDAGQAGPMWTRGDLTVRITGTSIGDDGVRTEDDAEELVIPGSEIDGQYRETVKRWVHVGS